ncbi:unnamed protein product [Haemonchus placei]|uniref:Ethanolamine kinase n=1 Tax=Haemonchus placei TaxID=6290 RepID=A0A0N4VWI5_HAEPC|nr:unnamed protein product [Haemonchus placei]
MYSLDFNTYRQKKTDHCSYLGENLPEEQLRSFLVQQMKVTESEPFHVRRFGHGQSNPTYYINIGGREVVLRKKPVRLLLESCFFHRRWISRTLRGLVIPSKTTILEQTGFCLKHYISNVFLF